MTILKITTQLEYDQWQAQLLQNEKKATKLRNRTDPRKLHEKLAAIKHIDRRTKLAEILLGNPSPGTRSQGEHVLQNLLKTEAAEEDFYQKRPELRWLQMLTPANDALRRPADDAARTFTTATAPGIPAIIATSRTDEPWVMKSPMDLEIAFAAITPDIHCDFQIYGYTEIDGKRYDTCVDWLEHVSETLGNPSLGDPQMRDRWVEKTFTTVPVARGELLILIRVCALCLGKFVYRNEIDAQGCVIDEPYADGFGSL